MRFVFSRLFFILLAAGFVPLSLSWNFSALRWFVLAYDVLLLGLVLTDWWISRRLPAGLTIKRGIENVLPLATRTKWRSILRTAPPAICT